MKISYVSRHDSDDVKKWSGLVYYMAQVLRESAATVNKISPLKEEMASLFKVKQLAYKHLLKKKYWRDREPYILKNYAQQVAKRLATFDSDLVFSEGTLPIAYLDSNQPIVFWTDATFAGLVDFYPEFSNLCSETLVNGNKAESLALERCSLAIYSSDWAAETAVKFYNINPDKIKVVPFGSNLGDCQTFEEVEGIIESRPSDCCRLLFLGVDWFRKGGEIALAVTKAMNDSGIKTQLTVVGCQPPAAAASHDFVNVVGFLSKSTPEGILKIKQLLASSHFLILPSMADCTPVVFSEANSFGVPCLSTDVGGIKSVIKDDVNGRCFARDASVSEYCDYISDLFLNYSQYKKLAISSFHEYQACLNWDVAGKKIRQLLENI